MALAMAREAKLPANETGARPGIVYASEQVHMSDSEGGRAAGHRPQESAPDPGRRRLPDADSTRSRRPSRPTGRAGRLPIAIVATAGTVNTGAIDPLPEIAGSAGGRACGCTSTAPYGGLAALAAPEKFARPGSAPNSLSLDAHKWLYQPVDCGCLLYRDPRCRARRPSRTAGDYVRILNRESVESIRLLRGIDRAVAALPRAEALDVAAVSRPPGLSRGHFAGSRTMPSCWRELVRAAAGTGAAGAGPAQRRLLPPPREGQRGRS